MNKEIMQQLGFANEVTLVEKRQCPFCLKHVVPALESFKDLNSFNEFKISGLCQECQDSMFDAPLCCYECNQPSKGFVLAIVQEDIELPVLYLCQECLTKALQGYPKLTEEFLRLIKSNNMVIEKTKSRTWKALIFNELLEPANTLEAETLFLLAWRLVSDKETTLCA